MALYNNVGKIVKSGLLARTLSTQVKVNPKINEDLEADYENARPFKELPGLSVFQLIKGFLPGGKFHKASFKLFLNENREKYGDIFQIRGSFGRDAMIITFNPEDFRKIWRTEGTWPTRPPMESLNHFRKNVKSEFYKETGGLLTTINEDWANFRTAVNPILMNPANVKLYLPKVSSINSEFIERIREIRDPETLEVPDNFMNEINRWTFESVVAVALDKELGLIRKNRKNDEAELLFKSLTRFFQLMVELDIKPPIWKVIRTPAYFEMMKVCENIHNITEKYVNEAIAEIEKRAEINKESEGEKSVIEKLIKKDKKVAMVMTMDMMLAGVDTTSTIFTGIMLSIAKNPEKQELLRKEITQILPNKNSPVTIENMKNLPYLRACIKEAIRVYPLGAGTMRHTRQDLVLSGYNVPKGSDVIMNIEALMVDEKYFSESTKFIPERWLRNKGKEDTKCPVATKAENPYIYLPFGFGPRACVGKRVVELELEIGIAKIVRNYYVEFNYPTENAFTSHMMNTPNIPLKFKFTDVEY